MISRHSQNILSNNLPASMADPSEEGNINKMVAANYKSKNKTTRSGSGIPSASGLQRAGGVNSVISNISSGIA